MLTLYNILIIYESKCSRLQILMPNVECDQKHSIMIIDLIASRRFFLDSNCILENLL